MKHLVFQIAAPLMSWGNELARRNRPTDGHPRKSAILGLLGAALGKARSDPWHKTANDRFGFATAVLRPGTRITDYHTVATPQGKGSYESRRDELEASDYTIETEREYLSDAYFLIALWESLPGADLERLKEALDQPVWELFAGRKSCPFSLPLAPILLDTPSLQEAFTKYGYLWKPLLEHEAHSVYWEDHPNAGIASLSSTLRADALVHLEKKLYRQRQEYHGTVLI